MNADLNRPVGLFFGRVDRDDALVMTTFGCDERTVVRLLKRHSVPHTVRLILFCDIVNHRNPGYLTSVYDRSCVVAVQLKPRCGCPVFHSKVWVHIPRNRRSANVAVTSMNLTAYHLQQRESDKTMETFVVCDGVRLPANGLIWEEVRRFMRRPTCQSKRLRSVSPETMLLDCREPVKRLVVITRSAVWSCIKKIVGPVDKKGTALAAPFVSSAVAALFGRSADVFTGEHDRSRIRLHAKWMEVATESGWAVIGGSPNLTRQAFGLGKDNGDRLPRNHETIVIADRPHGFRLKNILRGFDRFDTDEEEDAPCDYDPEIDDRYLDWSERRRLAVMSPERVYLALRQIGRAITVKVVCQGGWRKVTKVILLSASGDGLEFRPGQSIDQARLCKVLLSPPVNVIGMNGRKKQWQVPLDFGELWAWLDRMLAFQQHVKAQEGEGTDGADEDHTKGHPRGIRIPCDDVRHMRQHLFNAYTIRKGTREYRSNEQKAMRWFVAHYRGDGSSRFPNWIAVLVHALSKNIHAGGAM